MLSFKSLLGLVALLLALSVGCGPAQVHTTAADGCDGSNLEDCRSRCGQNQARACYRLGWYYEQGQNVSRNVKQALELYDKACTAGMAVACRALGMIYQWGDDGVSRNSRRAAHYYERACSLGLEAACLTDAEKRRLAKQGRKGTSDSSLDLSVEASTGD